MRDYLHDEFVALCADIRSDSDYTVVITLNQSLLNGDVITTEIPGKVMVKIRARQYRRNCDIRPCQGAGFIEPEYINST